MPTVLSGYEKYKKFLEGYEGYLEGFISVLLPENLHTYFELSAQAWILYKAPQWNARYPDSCPE
jgi:hypothetical protein